MLIQVVYDWIHFFQREWPLWWKNYLFVAVIVGIGLTSLWDNKKIGAKKAFVAELLVLYIYAVFIITVLSRVRVTDVSFEVNPIVSFTESWTQLLSFRKDIINNIIMFIPFGVLNKILFDKKWYWLIMLTIAFSSSIELLQFTLKCGYAQTLDIINNAIGAFIGSLFAYLFTFLKNNVSFHANKTEV